MRKLIPIGIVFSLITLFTILGASASFYPGENATLYGICINGTTEFLETNASINIWYPNGTILFENEVMIEYDIGRFNYNLIIPNTTGTYQTMINCTLSDGGTETSAIGWDSFLVSMELEFWHIAVILGFFGIIAILLLISTNFEEVWQLKVLLYGVSLLFASLSISAVTNLIPADVNLGTLIGIVTGIVVWSIYLFIIYLFIYTMVYIFKVMSGKKAEKKKKGLIEEDFDNF